MSHLLIWIEANPGVAAWLQAFGAIAGIGIAILVPARQARAAAIRERRILADELRARNAIMEYLIEPTITHTAHCVEGTNVQRSDEFRKAYNQISAARLAVTQVPLSDLRSDVFVRAFVWVAQTYTFQQFVADSWNRALTVEEITILEEYRDKLLQHREDLSDEIERVEKGRPVRLAKQHHRNRSAQP